MESNSSEKTLLEELLPLLVLTGLLAATLAIAVSFFILKPKSSSHQNYVVFDVVKLVNAQRSVASALLKDNAGEKSETTLLLLDISKRTQDVVNAAAKGRIVLVKQAVVDGDIEDITDEVLTELKLPKNVPTADVPAEALSQMPTYLMPMSPSAGAGSGQLRSVQPNKSLIP